MSETEKKVRSIRADEEVYAKFKAVCEDMGGQNEGLSALITAYELSTAKKLLSGQADSISDFQAKIDSVVQAYVSALEITAGTETRIRADFKAQLDSQTQTIISLQQRTAALESDLKEQEDEYKAKIGELNGTVLELNAALAKAQETAANAVTAKEQADKIAALATDKAEQLETEVQKLKDKANASDEYRAKSEQLFDEVEKLKVEVERLQAIQRTSEREYTQTLNDLKAKAEEEKTRIEENHKRELEIEVKSAKVEIAEKYQAQIEKLQQQHSAQISDLLLSQKKVSQKKKSAE